MVWQQWVLIVLFVLAALTTIGQIDKPREALRSGVAVFSVAIQAALIWLVTTI